MHETLRPDNISRLPESLQDVATCAMNGSLSDLEDVAAWARNKPKIQSILLLPVFFANLELSTMPSPDEMDVPSLAPPTVERILKAVRALDAIVSIQGIVPASGVDIWPRFWGWTKFVHTYRDNFPHAPTEMRLGMRMMRLITHIQRDKGSRSLVDATTGFRTLVARIWVLLQAVNPEKRNIGFNQLSPFIRFHIKPSDPTHLEEIIEGAGGSVDALASLVVNHLKLLTPAALPAESIEILDLFDALFTFIMEIDDQPNPLAGTHGPVCAALLSSGIVPALATAIKVLAEAAESHQSSVVVNNLIVTLKAKLYTPPADQWIAQAIEAGFLRGLVCHAVRGTGPMDDSTLIAIFDATLPPYTVHYSVVSKLGDALRDVKDLVQASKFRRSKAFKYWKSFQDLAEERLLVLEHFHANVSKRACDNMECGKIAEKTAFRRCAACQKRYYCSVECQSIDWHEGPHREVCEELRTLFLDPLSKKNLSFLRTVLDYDYQAQKHDMLCQQVAFIRQHPGEPFAAFCNYKGGRRSIDIIPAKSLEKTVGPTGRYTENASRAARSGGRMELHFVLVWDHAEARVRPRIFPLRRSSSKLYDGLHQLANDTSLVKGRSRRLIDRIYVLVAETDPELVEVHERSG
ncbi:hypothetical protein B0H10DRAFT_2193696 [Mycena sp. CBHHK59/15]|nr:hypothetical protein B0H10DRAFT_2193696 [Mycena sp. CBHHK59/15]